MPVLLPRATPMISERLRILETYIETLKAENESLKRQLADAEKRVARREATSVARRHYFVLAGSAVGPQRGTDCGTGSPARRRTPAIPSDS
jgi:hypothetical protein